MWLERIRVKRIVFTETSFARRTVERKERQWLPLPGIRRGERLARQVASEA
ncbi:MAG: hypothetical protein RIR86_2589 [Acidobacteriota bacterium]|jgi:hypothetical protein